LSDRCPALVALSLPLLWHEYDEFRVLRPAARRSCPKLQSIRLNERDWPITIDTKFVDEAVAAIVADKTVGARYNAKDIRLVGPYVQLPARDSYVGERDTKSILLWSERALARMDGDWMPFDGTPAGIRKLTTPRVPVRSALSKTYRPFGRT
jgi:hypothetical protein